MSTSAINGARGEEYRYRESRAKKVTRRNVTGSDLYTSISCEWSSHIDVPQVVMDNYQKCMELSFRNLILIYREPTVFHIHMRKIEILYIERKLYISEAKIVCGV